LDGGEDLVLKVKVSCGGSAGLHGFLAVLCGAEGVCALGFLGFRCCCGFLGMGEVLLCHCTIG